MVFAEAVRHRLGQSGSKIFAAFGHLPDRGHQLGRRALLGDIAGRAGLQRANGIKPSSCMLSMRREF